MQGGPGEEAAERMAALVLEFGTATMEMAAFMVREGPEMARLLDAAQGHKRRVTAAESRLAEFVAAHPDIPIPPMPDGPRRAAALSLIPLRPKN